MVSRLVVGDVDSQQHAASSALIVVYQVPFTAEAPVVACTNRARALIFARVVVQDGRAAIESAAAALESQNSVLRPATRDLSALDGRWRVRFSDAPPPSNGALGPFVGEPFQIVDSRSQSYVNELGFLNGALKVELAADFEPSSDTALRVCFRTLRLVAFGVPLPAFNFPAGTERTWLLTYTDDEMRLVRAGVDGGRSTARELGLISEDEGQSADAYLFVLTRAPDAPPASDPISRFVNDRKRKQLKQRLLDACDGQDFGASSTDADADAIAAIVDELAPLNPTAAPARSPLLQGVWRVEWTTEAELLYLTKNGLPGIAGEAAYQAIRPVAVTTADATADTITNADTGTFNGADKAERTEAPQRLQLVNRVALERGNGLTVNSSCDPASDDSVNFRFSSCSATLYGLTFPLPPVGTGSFNVLYLDEALRICRDSRGDLQICSRAVEGEVDI
uniref:Plastid lipid-associated protein/fibrillin conserved domain-containing protein n=1 Tax=Chrysotila carterae TaxID=13221 RepID=A0A7S4FCQ3_CHRCT